MKDILAMIELLVATTNSGKFAEVQAFLSAHCRFEFALLGDSTILPEWWKMARPSKQMR